MDRFPEEKINTSDNTEESSVEKPQITEILRLIRSQRATDPRDKSYSLYFIFKQMNLDIVAPDYEKTCSEVYLATAKATIEHDQNLDILGQAFLSERWPELPSRVPDWSISEVPVPTHLRWRHSRKTYIPKYSFESNNRVLRLKGMVVDAIREQSGTSFNSEMEKDGVPLSAPQLSLDPDMFFVTIKQTIQQTGVYCHWVKLVLAVRNRSATWTTYDAFIQILLGGRSMSK